MNYEQHYNILCSSRQQRKQDFSTFYEKHHIVPRCKGGTDDPSNLVYLTPREHYIAHLLLHKANPNDVKLYWPLQWFYDKRGVRIPSRIVQALKEDRSRFVGLRDYSWTKSNQHRQKMRDNYVGHDMSYRASKEYRENQSNKVKQSYETREKVSKESSTGRFVSRRVIADGVEYPSLSAVAKQYNISSKSAYNRVNKDTWPNWSYG
jgi:hypothetical protein